MASPSAIHYLILRAGLGPMSVPYQVPQCDCGCVVGWFEAQVFYTGWVGDFDGTNAVQYAIHTSGSQRCFQQALFGMQRMVVDSPVVAAR